MTLCIVTVIWDQRVIKVDVNTKRKQSHLKQLLVKEHGLDRSYRLIFKGQELEERPLDEQGRGDVARRVSWAGVGRECCPRDHFGTMGYILVAMGTRTEERSTTEKSRNVCGRTTTSSRTASV